MKLHVLFALICSVSFSVAASSPSVHDSIFTHVVGCPFEWLKSEPYNPEHLYLTLVTTRTHWVKFMCGPQVTFSPIFTPPHAAAEQGEEQSPEEEIEEVFSGGAAELLEASNIAASTLMVEVHPDDLPIFVQYVQNFNTLNLLINFWEHFPSLIPLQEATRAAIVYYQNNPAISTENAPIWFDTIVSNILLELTEQMHPARRAVLDTGIEELIQKMNF